MADGHDKTGPITRGEFNDMRDLMEQIVSQLATLNAHLGQATATSSITSTKSVLPRTSLSSRAVFQPIHHPIDALYPGYSGQTKDRLPHPGVFSGGNAKSVDFITWVQEIGDKLEADQATFCSEESRIRYVVSKLDGDALASIMYRLNSKDRPFGSVADVIYALEVTWNVTNEVLHPKDQSRPAPPVWENPIKAEVALRDIKKLRFQTGKNNDIYKFMLKFNRLAQEAKIPENERPFHLEQCFEYSVLETFGNLRRMSYRDYWDAVCFAVFDYERCQESRAARLKREAQSKVSSRVKPKDGKKTGTSNGSAVLG